MADSTLSTDSQTSNKSKMTAELQQLERGLGDANAMVDQLPFPDVMFGGGMLVLVIMVHAFFIRLITNSFLKRSQAIRARALLWRADLLFAMMVVSLLALHLSEVVLWAGAMVAGGLFADWGKAVYFAANCYTTMGEPYPMTHDWRLVSPIIAMSGIFTTAWTASVLVNFVARYNELRAGIMAVTLRKHADHRARP